MLLAGWTPLFCDVDPATGLVPDHEWQKALELGVDALLFVHLFGNPADPRGILAACQARGVFFLEDACQALGASVDGRPCGSFGDASVLSFGYTKLIDAGSGGMLLSDDAALVAEVAKRAGGRAYLSAQRYQALQSELSRLFYERKEKLAAGAQTPAAIFAGLIARYGEVVPAPWEADAALIAARLGSLRQSVAERLRKAGLYAKLLAGSGTVSLGMAGDSAPWRYCFRVPGIGPARQESISASLRLQGVHLSNWYLPTHWMVEQPQLATGALAGTERLAAEVFQLWLDESTDDARIAANAAAFLAALAA